MIDKDERRHWIEGIGITQIGDRYFGFHAATTTGDMSPSDKGFEPNNLVGEYTQYKELVETIIWKEVK